MGLGGEVGTGPGPLAFSSVFRNGPWGASAGVYSVTEHRMWTGRCLAWWGLAGISWVCFLRLTGTLHSERGEEAGASTPILTIFPNDRGFESLSKFLLSTYYVLGTGPGVGRMVVKQKDMFQLELGASWESPIINDLEILFSTKCLSANMGRALL